MFNDQYDPEYSEFRYSEGLDCLIALAHAFVVEPEEQLRLQSLMSEWRAFVKTSLDASMDIQIGMNTFHKVVEEAIDFLRGPETVPIEADNPWKTQEALSVLDQIVVLAEYIESAPIRHDLPDVAVEAVNSLNFLIRKQKALWCHRFICLNEWRREFRSLLAPELQPLLPWYDIWTDIPEDTVEEFIEKWDAVRQGDFSWSSIPSEMAAALFEDIKQDPQFYRYMHSSARLQIEAAQALQKSMSLGLFMLAEEEASKGELPEKVAEKGIQELSRRAIARPISSEGQRLERQFLAAFCGLDLDNDQRLEIFDRVEKILIHEDYAERFRGDILNFVVDWWNNRNPAAGRKLAEELYGQWLRMLEEEADAMNAPVQYVPGAFLSAVMEIETAPIEISESQKEPISHGLPANSERDWVALGRDFFDKIDRSVTKIADIPLKWGAPDDYFMEMAAGKPEKPPADERKFEMVKPYYQLPLTWSERNGGRYRLLGNVSNQPSFMEFHKFVDRHRGKGFFYWAGLIEKGDGRTEFLPPEEIKDLPCHSVTDKSCKRILVFVAFEQEVLQRLKNLYEDKNIDEFVRYLSENKLVTILYEKPEGSECQITRYH